MVNKGERNEGKLGAQPLVLFLPVLRALVPRVLAVPTEMARAISLTISSSCSGAMSRVG